MSTQEVGDGKYKIIRRLAVGGMAEIYLAEAVNIHGFRKKVVIKRILPQYANDQSYVEMFLDEARLAARLNHASIVQVFDIGEDPEGVFFTMEYVDGRDLGEILGACFKVDRILGLEEVLAVLMPAAEALHHAHELRDDNNKLCHLIHRDVSPSNILVTNEGRVKLLDFGVAKSNDQQRQTTGVSLKGKFGYMSAEQCQGLKLDRRCDIFSFGVVLWELCTGKRLYPGGNDPSVLFKIMNEDAPPPSSQRPDLPAELDRICLMALARDRANRYCTLQDMIHDLDEYAKHSGIVTNSRTLSRLLDDVFPETRPTEAIPVVQPNALPLPVPDPSILDSPQVGQGYMGGSSRDLAPYAAHAVSHGAGVEPSYPGYAPPATPSYSDSSGSAMGSYGGSATKKNKAAWILGIAVVLAGGVGVAMLGGSEGAPNDATPAESSIAPAAAGEVEAKTAPDSEVATDTAKPAVADTAAEEQAATAEAKRVAEEQAATAEAKRVAAEQAAATERAAAEQAAATLAAAELMAVDLAAAAEVERVAAEQAAEEKAAARKAAAKTRNKRSRAKTKGNKTKKLEEKWDPNSPFAPE